MDHGVHILKAILPMIKRHRRPLSKTFARKVMKIAFLFAFTIGVWAWFSVTWFSRY